MEINNTKLILRRANKTRTSNMSHVNVDFYEYYSKYDGHPVSGLKTIHDSLRADGKNIIFLAGDSSLDNKFWFSNTGPAINGYEKVLHPAKMKLDVCRAFNRECVKLSDRNEDCQYACLNTAIEASTLNNRSCGKLLDQDKFIRESITNNDILVVSVGFFEFRFRNISIKHHLIKFILTHSLVLLT